MTTRFPVDRPTACRACKARTVTLALGCALLALVAGCNKPGDPGGGTARERSAASPASTPTPSLPEPSPGSDKARTAPVPPGPATSPSAPR